MYGGKKKAEKLKKVLTKAVKSSAYSSFWNLNHHQIKMYYVLSSVVTLLNTCS